MSYGSWGTPKFPTQTQLAARRKKKSSSSWYSGLTEFTGNLLNDVRDTVVGLPMGLKNLATHPISSMKEIGVATWHDWSPLFEGDVDKWWHQFTAHPLAPILDVAGFVTLGAGTAARATSAVGKLAEEGSVLSRAGKAIGGTKISRESGNAVHGFGSERKITEVGGKAVKGIPDNLLYRDYHRNPVIRARQQAFEKVGNKVADKFGSAKRVQAGGVHYELKGMAKIMGDARFINKKLGHMSSDRSAALRRSQLDALKAARDLFAKGTSPAVIATKLGEHFDASLVDHSMKISKQMRGGGRKSGLGKGFMYIADPKHWKDVDPPPGATVADWQKWSKQYVAKRGILTKDPKLAGVKMENGKASGLQTVRTDAVGKWFEEAHNSLSTLDILYHKPTKAWKWLVLANSPRFFVNNVVGNSFMYFMATNPKAAVDGLYRANREIRGEKKATKQLSVVDQEMRKIHGAVDSLDATKQSYAGVSAGLGADVGEDLGGLVPAESRRGAMARGAKMGLYGVTHKYAEDLIRRAALHHSIKRTPEYWEARGNGLTHQAAYARASQYERVRNQMRTSVNNVLGDYNNLNKLEQQVKRMVPFYTWDRAIMRHTWEMTKNQPYKAAFLTSVGEQGIESTREMLGNVPSFMEGSIPLGSHAGGVLGFLLGGQVAGRVGVMTTQGLNPYATVGELVGAAGSVAGVGQFRPGETLGGQLNPLLAGGAEYLTGHSLLSGAELPKKHGGIIGNIYGNALEQIPQARLIDSLARGGPKRGKDKDHPLLFQSDPRQQLSSFFGAPTKQMSKKTARDLYNREHGITKKRKKAYASPYGTSGYKTTPGL